ncbi:hypothetical protein PFISCL1PPCAC_24464, partial [Pristionchus fissidentatus]
MRMIAMTLMVRRREYNTTPASRTVVVTVEEEDTETTDGTDRPADSRLLSLRRLARLAAVSRLATPTPIPLRSLVPSCSSLPGTRPAPRRICSVRCSACAAPLVASSSRSPWLLQLQFPPTRRPLPPRPSLTT